MAALTSLMTRFCVGEDSWLARKGTSDPSTSEIRDGNGKPWRNKNKRQNKEESPDNTRLMPDSGALDLTSKISHIKAVKRDRPV